MHYRSHMTVTDSLGTGSAESVTFCLFELTYRSVKKKILSTTIINLKKLTKYIHIIDHYVLGHLNAHFMHITFTVRSTLYEVTG